MQLLVAGGALIHIALVAAPKPAEQFHPTTARPFHLLQRLKEHDIHHSTVLLVASPIMMMGSELSEQLTSSRLSQLRMTCAATTVSSFVSDDDDILIDDGIR